MDKISLFVAKITFVVTGISFKVAVVTSSVARINFAVGEITFILVVITSSVDEISFLLPRSLFWWL